MNFPKRTVTFLISAGLLCVGYVLTRYVFFDLHGMKQWPLTLLIIGAIISGISVVQKARVIPIVIGAAYSVSFLMAALMQTDSVDAGGMRTNNLWIIWTGVFLFLTAASIVAEFAVRAKNNA